MKNTNYRWMKWTALVLAAAWAGNSTVGRMVADNIAQTFGPKIIQAGAGKISDPSVFIQGRASEAIWVATCAFGLALLVIVTSTFLSRRSWFSKARGVWLGLLGFLALNGVVAVANQTALFWVPFFDSHNTDNYAQFQIKRHLLGEHTAENRIALLGNSQVSSNISENVLNAAFSQDAWFTELHQSGVHGFDMLIVERELRDLPVKGTVLYVTPIYFYGGTNGKVASRFFGLREVPDILRLHGWSTYPDGALRTGLFGESLPLYRHNQSFSQRLLGAATTGIAQRRFDASLEPDLDAQARRRAGSLLPGPESEMHSQAFSLAIGELAKIQDRVVIIAGKNYPLFEELTPAGRAGMQATLAEIGRKYPKVTILQEDSFFQSRREDFVDLIHFGPEAQTRFSEALARELRSLGIGKRP